MVFSSDEGFDALGIAAGLHSFHTSLEFEVLPRLAVGATFRLSGVRAFRSFGQDTGSVSVRLHSETVLAGARYYLSDRWWLAPFLRLAGGATFAQLDLLASPFDGPGECEPGPSDECVLSQRRSQAVVPLGMAGAGVELLLPRRPRGTEGAEQTVGLRVELGTMLGGGPGPTPALKFQHGMGSLAFGFLYMDLGAVYHF
jgi:hypothetical protein